jgi:hypothetical protein
MARLRGSNHEIGKDTMSELGPLAPLVGIWESSEGLDVSYQYGPGGRVETPFRERMTFEPTGLVENGKQRLFGLDYRTNAWRLDEEDPFHAEVGYWLWDADAGHVMRCFMVPRGSTILAGGDAAANAESFELRAERGDPVHGILSNPHLDAEARTTHYTLSVRFEAGQLIYEEDVVLELAGQSAPFHHTDRNRLTKVG